MATPAIAAAKMTDGRYGCIYVHFDGYPSYMMLKLEKGYNKQDKVDELIAIGNCVVIDDTIDECEPYGLIEGEDAAAHRPTIRDTLGKLIRDHGFRAAEFMYTWEGAGWTFKEI